MDLALRVQMRREFDEELDKVKFSMSLQENVLVTSFSIFMNIFIITH